MFVTSDTFALKRIARFRDFDWKENLLGGVAVHGTNWRGYESLATFFLEAAKRCGVLKEMKYAGYNRPGDKRTRSIQPKSFERLARGELGGAKNAHSVLFRGQRDAVGAQFDKILFGGEASGAKRSVGGPTGHTIIENYPYRAFDGAFVFPLEELPDGKARELFILAVDILDAEYGYFFVRDDLCQPWTYTHGIGCPLDFSALNREESDEIGRWFSYYHSGALWTDKWPLFRDLFQLNLLSERHTATPVEGIGYLQDWISAQAGRGALEEIGAGRLLWSLTDAEMVEVRPILDAAGLLFSCRERVYRDLPKGAEDARRLHDQYKVRWAP